MWHDPLFEKVAKIVDPNDKLSGGEIIKLVEEKFKSTNIAMPKCSCRGCMNPKTVGVCDCCGGVVTNHPALRQ